jgi:hypothetical protein
MARKEEKKKGSSGLALEVVENEMHRQPSLQ